MLSLYVGELFEGGNVRLFYSFTSWPSDLSRPIFPTGLRNLAFSSVYQDHVLLLRSPIGLVDQSHTLVWSIFSVVCLV